MRSAPATADTSTDMNESALRPDRQPVLRRRANRSDVEALVERIGELVRERQDLRRNAASLAALERNRLELGEAQRDLSLALIEAHHGPPPAA